MTYISMYFVTRHLHISGKGGHEQLLTFNKQIAVLSNCLWELHALVCNVAKCGQIARVTVRQGMIICDRMPNNFH